MSGSEKDTKMTAEALHDEMGHRVALWFREKHPRHTAKLLARDLAIAEPTAKKIISGRFPSSVIFTSMLKREGAAFAGFVMQPLGDWASVLSISAELDILDERAARAREDLTALRADLAGEQ
jgi:hypothetical protein